MKRRGRSVYAIIKEEFGLTGNKSTVLADFEKLIVDVIKNEISDNKKVQTSNKNFFKAITTVIIADVSMSLDNVLGVAGAAREHYILLVFGLILSILLMATVATIISKWIKKYKWIGWIGLLTILAVAIELIYNDFNNLKILI